MRLAWFLILFALLFAQNFDKEIEKTSQGLSERLQREKALNNRLEELGNEVEKYNKQIQDLDKKISTSSNLVARNKTLVKQKVEELGKLDKEHVALQSQREGIESELVRYLSEELAFVILLEEYSLSSPEEMIQQDVFSVLSADSKQKINTLTEQQNQILNQIKQVEDKIATIKDLIETENNRQKGLDDARKKQKEALIGLSSQLKRYNSELNKILQERENLQRLLETLNIKKQEERERNARQKERELAQKNMSQSSQTSSIQKIDVRQVGSSYHNVRTTKYTGTKTIAPLDKYKIERKFGPYYDPIYNLQTFSESVTFIPLESSAKVKSVLAGEVIFAKEVPLLKKVVVVKHANNLHTIYAQLDEIATGVSVGKKVSRGFVIGRVENKLMLEVTQKNLHLDPLELISVK